MLFYTRQQRRVVFFVDFHTSVMTDDNYRIKYNIIQYFICGANLSSAPTIFLKELESMKKKQCKEMASVVKSQCSSIEKAAKGKTFNTVEQVMTCDGLEL